ncbi:MAG TPA: hypothetical protein VE992_02135, partial [Solirubrobacteraceae bacterium]|nr:hypothetical protein [Solirubrobacteraceae bacterium]
MTDRQRNGLILLLVLGLIAASAVVMTQYKTRLGLDLKGGVELIYQGEPSAQTPVVTQDALARAVDIMRERVDQLGVAEPEIQTSGDKTITVALPDINDIGRAEQLVGKTAQLEFYDWEANALTPSGEPVAKALQTQDPTAQTISQGAGSVPSGGPGAGSMGLYQAVQLAAKQPKQVSSDNSRIGPEYFMFGAPGSAACQAAAKYYGVVPVVGQHCLLSGPDDNLTDLYHGLPPGVSRSQGQLMTVQRGWVVLQATTSNVAKPLSWANPSAQFYVLRDHVSLFGNEITNPQQSTDSVTGEPDVTFGFTSKGQGAFASV